MRYLFFIIISFSTLFADAHIFVYHRFGDARYPSTNTTIKELTKQFEYFKKYYYKVVPLKNIIEKLEKNENIPDKWIALTIDDTFESFYTNGLKVFRKYNYPFSLYVYVKAVDRHYGDFMSWKQIKDASKYGEIGLHSYSHPRLETLTQNEIIQDTKKAYDLFIKNLDIKPKSYAYPYGEYNAKVRKILKDNFDFKFILNQNTGSVNKKTNIYDIPRIALVGTVNINNKLRYKTFDATLIEPKIFPKDGILKQVYAKVDKKYKKLKLYITGDGWRDIKVKDGIVNVKLNIFLKKARTRIMLGPDIFTISNKVINKTTQNVFKISNKKGNNK